MKSFCFFLYTILFTTFSTFLLPSCNNGSVSIVGVDSRLILDYSKISSLDSSKVEPQVRLSVCIEVLHESSAADKRQLGGVLRIVSPDGQLEWICNEVYNAGRSSNGAWVGYANFVPAPNEYFKSGTYLLCYIEETGQQIETSFEVNYPQELLQKGISELTSFSDDTKEELISMYDENGALLYLDKEENDSFNAKTKLKYILFNNGSLVCILPIE